MTHNWKPGDVATTGGDSRITFHQDRDLGELMFTNAYGHQHPVRHLALDARPLVVIDPADREQVERLARDYVAACNAATPPYGVGDVDMEKVANEFATALREFAAPTPPKPNEPQGRYAVVEDDRAREWVRAELCGVSQWQSIEGRDSRWADWDDLAAVRVVSEGVTA